MTNITQKPYRGSTNRCFSITDSLVLVETINPYILVGNIIPREWYQKFTNNRGSADLSLMSVLSEIVYWYRPKRLKDSNTMTITYVNKFLGDAWQTSYEHFEKKFGFNREKLRRIFVKLEKMGICAREFRTIKLRGQTYNNRLFIHLSSDFLNSCTSNKRKISDYENYNTNCNTSFSLPKEEGGSPRFEGDYIIDNKNKNIIEDRSIKSNFCKTFFKEKTQTNLSCCKTQESKVLETTNQIKSRFSQTRTLKEFYPLNANDCTELQSLSGRDFSLNAMNEILCDMSKRLTDRFFKSRKRFLSYMSKAFAYEMRDAVVISGESFKIKANQCSKEKEFTKQEKFLTEVEYSMQVSPEWHLKKKLASVLERKKAYYLLQSYKSLEFNGNTAIINLDKNIELSTMDMDIILAQIQATHEGLEQRNNCQPIEFLELAMPIKTNSSFTSKSLTDNIQRSGIWGKIRAIFAKSFGDDGDAIDHSWISKLEAHINENNKTINLQAPSEFIKDCIEERYLLRISQVINNIGFKLESFTCKKNGQTARC